MKIKYLILFAVLLSSPLMAAPSDFTVTVTAVTGAGGVTYRYSVTNNLPANVANPVSITSFTIGRELEGVDGNRMPQIKDVGGDAFGGARPVAPAGWSGSFGRYQEMENHWVDWQLAQHDRTYRIQPGKTLQGFSVFSTVADDAYLNGFWYIVTDRGVIEQDRIIRTDTLPPTLSVVLTPSTMLAGSTLLSVVATITVTDNYDPASVIKLESITANQILSSGDISDAMFGTDDRAFCLKPVSGRSYTVSYSATDGSGNKATVFARVTVSK